MQLGWNSSFLTTNFAQALCKLLLAFKTKRERYTILLLTCSYDWTTYFSPCVNKKLKNYNRPLAWRTRKREAGALPTSEVKTWGAAQGEWHGINDDPNGEPIKIFVKRPGKIITPVDRYSLCVCTEGDLPPKLPVGAFVTPRLKKDIRYLSRYCGPEEREWMEEMLRERNLTRVYIDGDYGSNGLPGKPAHMESVDASGKLHRIDLQLVDEIPRNWLELPPQRREKILALHNLTTEELKSLPRTYFVNDGNPPAHPPWRGAQELTPEEKQAQDIAFASASAPWRKVNHLLRISENKETFAASHMVMKELKLWLREHGVATQDKDRKQFVKKKLIDLVWEHYHICSCGLEDDDNKDMKYEVDAPLADEPEQESGQEPEPGNIIIMS